MVLDTRHTQNSGLQHPQHAYPCSMPQHVTSPVQSSYMVAFVFRSATIADNAATVVAQRACFVKFVAD